MTALENDKKAIQYIVESSSRVIDYQWEIQHHKQMHEAYESRL